VHEKNAIARNLRILLLLEFKEEEENVRSSDVINGGDVCQRVSRQTIRNFHLGRIIHSLPEKKLRGGRIETDNRLTP
jgi:hypothetical protein